MSPRHIAVWWLWHRQVKIQQKPGLYGQIIKLINSCQAQGDLALKWSDKASIVELIKDVKAAITIKLHEKKIEINEKTDVLSTEINY